MKRDRRIECEASKGLIMGTHWCGVVVTLSPVWATARIATNDTELAGRDDTLC